MVKKESDEGGGESVVHSVAFRMALRGLRQCREQLEAEEFATVLQATGALCERVATEAKQREEQVTQGKQWERQKVGALEERLRLADGQVDLLRNAVGRRDALLAQQRSAYYRDLLQYKGEKASGTAPAPTYEAALHGAPVAERPQFFDACVFEAIHLSSDMDAGEKVALKHA